MSDNKLRCALIYRVDATIGTSAAVTMLAKYDHSNDYESHAGATSDLMDGRGKSYADAIGLVITNDPPVSASMTVEQIGGFKVVQSELHQVVYGGNSEGLCLAVVTGLHYPSRVVTQMLLDMYSEMPGDIKEKAKTATSNSLSRKSAPFLTKLCQKYSDVGNVDKAAALVGKVEEVKSQMQDNIASMLQNIERTESISNQADQLNEQASVFKKKSNDLRKHMRCKNLKLTIILVALVVGILLVILVPVISKASTAAAED